MNFLTDISAVTARRRWTQLKAYQDYVTKLVIKKLIDLLGAYFTEGARKITVLLHSVYFRKIHRALF